MVGKREHPFKVEEWYRGNPVRDLAVCDHLDVAVAAYEQALESIPNRHIMLRHGARVMMERKAAAGATDSQNQF